MPHTPTILRRAALIAALALAPAHLLAHQPATPPPFEQLAAPRETLDDARRQALVRDMLIARDPDAITELAAYLQRPAQRPEITSAILRALPEIDAPPESLLPFVLDTLAQAEPAGQIQAIPAVAAFASPAAMDALLNLAQTATTPAISALALDQARLIAGLPPDAALPALRTWLDTARAWPPDRWRRHVSQRTLDRLREATQDATRARALASEAYRRLYVSLPAPPDPARARLIVDLLRSPQPTLRDTGLDIITRETSEGATPAPDVIAALAALLSSPEPAVRLRAATLCVAAPSESIRAEIDAAIARESSPVVASELLRAASRWPTPASAAIALQLLRQTAGAPIGAIEFLDAARRAEGLLDAQARAALLAELSRRDVATLPPAGLRMLADLGTDQDRARIASLLDLKPSGQRTAAAVALAPSPPFAARIIAAAAEDPALFDAAVVAAGTQQMSIQLYRDLERIPAPAAARDRALRSASRLLPVQDLITVAAAPDLSLTAREELLGPLAVQGPDLGRERPPADAAILTDALIALAEIRSKLLQPEGVLAALDAIPEASPAQVERARVLRVQALVRLNLLQTALAVSTTADDWMAALESCLNEPHAPAVASLVTDRFANALSAEQAARLADIRVSLSRATPPTSEPAVDPDVPDRGAPSAPR